jgi:DNA-binding protein HU-beta
MNRAELIEHVATRHEVSKAEAGRIVATILDAVVASVKKGETVAIAGFGSFKLTTRAARTGRNPRTGEAVKIAAAKLPRFTAGLAFKDAVDTKGAARRAAKKDAAVPAKKSAAKKAAPKKAVAKKR